MKLDADVNAKVEQIKVEIIQRVKMELNIKTSKTFY